MIKLWFVVALAIPGCLEKMHPAQVPATKYSWIVREGPRMSLDFANNADQVVMQYGYSERGVAAALFSRERPIYFLNGPDAACFEVAVGTVAWGGEARP